MFKPRADVVAEFRRVASLLPDDGLSQQLERELGLKRPDLTEVLLRLAAAVDADPDRLGRVLTAAAVRAGCARLAERHPGATIEVRVPPFGAAQVGFGSGPTHTRGTPPNVVEMPPATFLALATGAASWADVEPRPSASGTQASDVARCFPLLDAS